MIRFNYKHYWKNKEDSFHRFEWKEKRIGIWFKSYKAVGCPSWFSRLFSDQHHIKQLLFGIDLIIFRAWVTISLGNVMTFKTKSHE